MHLACVNQDPGIAPERQKGAAIHLAAMRAAFGSLGARVTAIDSPDAARVGEALARAHAGEALDCIYERYALNAFTAGEFSRAQALPHVLEINAPLADEAAEHRAQVATVDPVRERDLFAHAKLLLVVSTALRHWAVQRGADVDHVLVRPNAVDSALFRPLPAEARAELGLGPAGRLVLGFHGRLRPWHNFELLLRATKRLLAQNVPVHLACIGDSTLGDRCRERLPADTWSLVPWLPHAEVARRVACFDVLPLTYAAQENFYFSPLKLLEAMACAVVPVVPNVGDLAQIVAHGVAGLVYDAGDLDGLVRLVRELHERPRWRAELGARARECAERSSWLNVARDVLARAGLSARECDHSC